MKIAFKNFLMTLKRYKVASLLNVLGLTLAFVAFYVIASQVWFTLTYNHSLKDADRTYLISPDFGGGGNDGKVEWSTNSPGALAYEAAAPATGRMPKGGRPEAMHSTAPERWRSFITFTVRRDIVPSGLVRVPSTSRASRNGKVKGEN